MPLVLFQDLPHLKGLYQGLEVGLQGGREGGGEMMVDVVVTIASLCGSGYGVVPGRTRDS